MLFRDQMIVLAIFAFCYTRGHALSPQEDVVYPSEFPGSASPWQKGHRVPNNNIVRIDIVLAVQETALNAGAKALQAISDPTSAEYGQHWTSQQVAQLFLPDQDHIRDVASWVNSSGIAATSILLSYDQTKLYFNTTVGRAEKLLSAQFHEYSNGQIVHAAIDNYSLPQTVSKLIDLVTPTIQLAQYLPTPGGIAILLPPELKLELEQRETSATLNVSCFKYMTPECLRLLYNFPDTTNITSHPNNSFGIYETAWSSWLPTDLDLFFTSFDPAYVGHRPTVLAVDGGYLQTDFQLSVFNLEPDLDFQYAIPLAAPLPITNIQVGDMFLLGDINNMLAAFDQEYCATGLDPNYDPIYPDAIWPGGYNATDCGVYSAPLVISISYASNEASYPEQYVQRQCLEFLKLGLQGTTVIAASGDYGTADQSRMCVDPKTGVANVTAGRFSNSFPASCPWVTSIGGTQLSATNQTWVDSSTKFPLETAFNYTLSDNITVATSGGGFSNTFSAPFYQSFTTPAYLNQPQYEYHLSNLSSAGYFNPQGRGYPDLAAMASNFLVYIEGGLHSVLGTSAAAPTFASMIAKINDARLHSGKRPVGFINPVLYWYASEVMTDVITGGNGGCGVPNAFPASKGWDAVTGLGTPDFEKLLDLYLSLP